METFFWRVRAARRFRLLLFQSRAFRKETGTGIVVFHRSFRHLLRQLRHLAIHSLEILNDFSWFRGSVGSTLAFRNLAVPSTGLVATLVPHGCEIFLLLGRERGVLFLRIITILHRFEFAFTSPIHG